MYVYRQLPYLSSVVGQPTLALHGPQEEKDELLVEEMRGRLVLLGRLPAGKITNLKGQFHKEKKDEPPGGGDEGQAGALGQTPCRKDNLFKGTVSRECGAPGGGDEGQAGALGQTPCRKDNLFKGTVSQGGEG